MNLVNLLTWIILGIPLMLTYTTVDKSFWVGIDSKKVMYTIYIMSIILASISGIATMVWSSQENIEDEKESELLTIGIIMLVGFSIGWVPMFQQSKINRNYKYATVLCLIGAAVGAVIIAHTAYIKLRDPEFEELNWEEGWGLVPAIYLVFQTGIMDLILWNIYYFGQK